MTSCPFYFGPPEARLFGCYHAPAPGARPRRGVLLCNPIGHEYMAAFRTVRQTAVRLARTGVPVLRFDYYGSGDSAGESNEGLPSHWVRDVALSAAELRTRLREPDVAVAGLRLGATLAYLHIAAAGAEARALILWDPVIDGRAYVAELIALQQARFGKVDHDDEILGFPFTASLRSELEAIDLMRADPPRAAQVLIVETGPPRDDVAAFAERLREHGAAVEHRPFPLTPLWHEPNKSAVHASVVQSVAQWTATRL